MFSSVHRLRQKAPPVQFFKAIYALNRSAAFRTVGDFERAAQWELKSLAELVGNAEASYNQHITYLKRGEYRKGYAAYCLAGRELRIMDCFRPSLPAWDGGSLQGKCILVAIENGFGDAFVALRFIERLKTRFGARRVVVRSHYAELLGLLRHFPGIDLVIGASEGTTDADCIVSSSLLLYHACEDFADLPGGAYIQPRADLACEWKNSLGTRKGLRVGIRWAGNPLYSGDNVRRFDPRLLFEVLGQSGLEVYSFQRDDGMVPLPEGITDLSPRLTTWEETTAALSQMDLVISSCTGVAHLAAAMGIETWVCVPVANFHTWAYLTEENRTPWYHSARIYRQKNVLYWDDVFERIGQDLSRKLGHSSLVPPTKAVHADQEVTYSPEPFRLPEGRVPLTAMDRIRVRAQFQRATKEKDIASLLSIYDNFPGWPPLNLALSGHFLDQGEFQKGYRAFDLLERCVAPNLRHLPRGPIPEWDGRANLEGKTILVASAQGQGADLLVGRFIPRLRKLGAKKVVGAVHVHMADFFAHQDFYDQIVLESDATTSSADYWVRINSLIYLLNPDFSTLDGAPYVTPSAARVKFWEPRFAPHAQEFKIGLRFAGNPRFSGNSERHFDPALLLKAVSRPGVRLFSFQRDADLPELPAGVVDLSADLPSWDDTAAALAHMDLVISSCTSVGHLAAAMGKPTWFCVPYDAYHCWRSPLATEGRTPWYDSARVFRQARDCGWEPVFADVSKALESHLNRLL